MGELEESFPEASKNKGPNWKGQSRALKMCHWCTKKQEPGVKPFQACSRCKQVIYCSKECQVKSWPFHKAPCKMAAEARKATANNPELTQQVANFKKWHAHHVELLKQAAVCALDLGNTPSNADNHVVCIGFDEKPDASALPAEERYMPADGFTLTLDEAKEMLTQRGGTSAVQLLDAGRPNHEFMKKKGGLGIMTLLLLAHGTCDITTIVLPSAKTAKLMQEANDWGDGWLECMAFVLARGPM
ncbi:hypothetical protein DENSPDRAFT_932741 [Dentipellis sp. KUC8613]|nr:hypothetical protein DENSPDRAFT_932741 [Dentipellis sp. KUC8613]